MPPAHIPKYKYEGYYNYSPATHVPRGGYHVLGAMHMTLPAPRRSGKLVEKQTYDTVAPIAHWSFVGQFWSIATPCCRCWMVQGAAK